jgi:hypothetical protein
MACARAAGAYVRNALPVWAESCAPQREPARLEAIVASCLVQRWLVRRAAVLAMGDVLHR